MFAEKTFDCAKSFSAGVCLPYGFPVPFVQRTWLAWASHFGQQIFDSLGHCSKGEEKIPVPSNSGKQFCFLSFHMYMLMLLL